MQADWSDAGVLYTYIYNIHIYRYDIAAVSFMFERRLHEHRLNRMHRVHTQTHTKFIITTKRCLY